ncbi:MAG: radical SAM-associated putative lipoprotein [Prevotellaceae bacterium]|jgi:putative lipoprotein (rSAM/lipoprotein system)|nr:radical SAM-associated putative lipoprotein [Prevotellaceae bacterium]
MLKRTHRSVIKTANWILGGIISILSFSGCHKEQSGTVEYGSPYATFSFRGTVSDKTGQPVKDIKVEVGLEKHPAMDNPVLTNTSGQYSVQFQFRPVEDFQVIVSDIDGESNGSFRNDTIPVKVSEDDYYEQGNGSWNHGSAAKEVNIVLNEKE